MPPSTVEIMKKLTLSSIARGIVEIIAIGVVVYTLYPLAKEQIITAQVVGNAPSGAADAPSEFDALTSAMHYYKEGFLANAGLPDRGTPLHEAYDDPEDVPAMKLIYTHYPPGPNWLVGVAMKVFGPKQVPLYRSFPIVFSIGGLLLAYGLLRSAVGCVLASAAMVTIIQVPMTTRMMHGLFFHPYALTLAIVQMAFLFNRVMVASRLTPKALFFIGLMSFFQGWLSFDWAFVAMFYPLAVIPCWIDAAKRRLMFKALIFSVGGFGFAHFLHFLQVWMVSPHFEHAFNDLFGAAIFRFKGEGAKTIPDGASRFLLQKYLFELIPSADQATRFSWILPAAGVGIALVVALFASIRGGLSGALRYIVPSVLSITAAFALSMAWIFVMKNHSMEQGHWMFLPRHFIIVVMSSLLVAAFALRELAQMVRGRSGSKGQRETPASYVEKGADGDSCKSRCAL